MKAAALLLCLAALLGASGLFLRLTSFRPFFFGNTHFCTSNFVADRCFLSTFCLKFHPTLEFFHKNQ